MSDIKYKWWHTQFDKVDKENLIKSFDNNNFTFCKETYDFELEFAERIGSRYAITTNSGTSAITMALISLGIEKGDEVIIPTVGWIATLQAVLFVGAKPVFVDVEKKLPIMDINQIRKKITKRTKAIIPVHYNGRLVEVSKIKKLIKNTNISIVEDTCKSMFSKNKDISNKFAGTSGSIGCFSFGMISLISCGYAGLCVTNDKKIYEKLNLIRWHGVNYLNKKKIHEIYTYNSFNFKPSNLLLSLAKNQLKMVNDRINFLKDLYTSYIKKIDNFNFIPVNIDNGEVPLLIDVFSEKILKVEKKLQNNGIGICRFHRPLNEAKYLTKRKYYSNGDFYGSKAFHLPSGIFRKDLNNKYFDILKNININAI